MLAINHQPLSFGNKLPRREFLRVGGLGMAGLSLADVLRADDASRGSGRRQKSLVYVVLNGGPSHIDLYDLKPEAPLEYRGPFHPIATKLPGVQICEHMPLQAAMMDQLALIRGIRSVENDHYLSEVYSGLPRTSGKRPAFGSIVSKLAPTTLPLPSYVCLDRQTVDPFEYEYPYYVGAAHAPFRPFDEALDDLKPFANRDVLNDRRALLSAFETLQQRVDRRLAAGGLDEFQTRALTLISSPQVREAFDLSQESPETLRRYGHKAGKYCHQTVKDILYDWDAKPFILARRLVEAGVRVVTLKVAAWDHHSGPQSDVFFALKGLMPTLDQSLAALFNDLTDRGLADDVLVVVLGEFGRTPKISYPGPGREHWAEAGCAVVFGGGLKMGQVIGATDRKAERSVDGKISFQNIMSTIYGVLGVNVDLKLPDFNGRPQHLLDDRNPIRELVL